ncbi:MAG TPA: VWA domain-containing protein [Nocardioidaceae bacterium]|nr:VWA domain-containing protein [Nocardioidaceae bacterium]
MADAAFAKTLVAFARELRAAGVPVGSGDVLMYCAGVAPLNPADLVDLYWAGRATLISRLEHIEVYDDVFRSFFLGDDPPEDGAEPFTPQAREDAQSILQLPEVQPTAGEQHEDEARLGLRASDAAVLRSKSFASCSPDELVALRRIMRAIRLAPPRRRSRRFGPDPAGRIPDVRRTVRQAMRTHGEPLEQRWRRRRLRPRPLVLILDVSGSMADYSRNLLQFAHTTNRAARRVEVFCFGTSLTRITRELEHRKPDDALDRAAAAVVDWDGGTRIGDSLSTYVREHGSRGIGRGGIVVVCSDGLDRGDPAVLERAMKRLTRQCHRIVWLNPHKGDAARFKATTIGMMVVEPHVDLVLSGHDLRSLEQFAALLPRLG